MKLLLASCVWGVALGRLRAAGHDVIRSGELAVVRELPHAGRLRVRLHSAGG